MNPIRRLLKELGTSTPSKGRVVAASANSFTIMTNKGVILADRSSTDPYVVGDEVVMSDGAIRGRVRNPSTLPVFYV